jgi:hypothetical protein
MTVRQHCRARERQSDRIVNLGNDIQIALSSQNLSDSIIELENDSQTALSSQSLSDSIVEPEFVEQLCRARVCQTALSSQRTTVRQHCQIRERHSDSIVEPEFVR